MVLAICSSLLFFFFFSCWRIVFGFTVAVSGSEDTNWERKTKKLEDTSTGASNRFTGFVTPNHLAVTSTYTHTCWQYPSPFSLLLLQFDLTEHTIRNSSLTLGKASLLLTKQPQFFLDCTRCRELSFEVLSTWSLRKIAADLSARTFTPLISHCTTS